MQKINAASLPALFQGDLFSRYIEYLDVSETSAHTYRRALKQLAGWLADENLSQPTRADILRYKKALQSSHKPTTVQSYLTACKLFFAWLESEGLYPNICAHLKGENIDPGFRRDYLTSSQIRAVLDGIDTSTVKGARDTAIITLMTVCGLRCIEISRADVSDLRPLGNRTVLYVHGKGRSDKTDFVIVPPSAELLVRNYLKLRPAAEVLFSSTSNQNCGQRMSTRAISGMIKQRLIDAGFDSERLTAHSLRHSSVTLALLSGQDIQSVRLYARHRSIQSTLVYAHNAEKADNACSAAVADVIL